MLKVIEQIFVGMFWLVIAMFFAAFVFMFGVLLSHNPWALLLVGVCWFVGHVADKKEWL